MRATATNSIAGKAVGEEDCLFLDVIVPYGIDKQQLKPVLIWFHGGGYMSGHRMWMIPTPLALHGDIIIVSVNYRLGSFGFLSDGLRECCRV